MKPHVNLVFIGHVDHGKSTTIGRLLFELGLVSEKDLHPEAGSFKFAWVMDREKEERERGLTIGIAYQKLETERNLITIIDAPGHRDFVKNMITGASQADAAVLVVAADDGIMPQTKEHAALAFTLGINQLIVAINKMDLVGYDRNVYEKLRMDLVHLLTSIGYRKAEEFPFIPMAAFHGENVTRPSQRMTWYSGPTLLQALEQLREPEKPIDKPLRIPIQNVFSITGVGTVPIGRVETGVLQVGDEVIFQPSGKGGEVKSIEMHHQPIPKALPGDNIGFNVRGLQKTDVSRGDVAGHPDKPPTVARRFLARVIILNVPHEIRPGFTPSFHCHTANVPGTIEEIQKKIDPKSGGVLEENPPSLKKGDAGVVKVSLLKPMVLEKVSEIPQLGRFAIRHGGITIGAGICTDLL
jgi:elongation factor 1-alpha